MQNAVSLVTQQTKVGDYLLFGSFIIIIYPMHEDMCSLSEAVHHIS
jgi:hypothetical protein